MEQKANGNACQFGALCVVTDAAPVRRSPKAGVLDQRVTAIKVRKAVMKWVQ